VLVNGIDTLLTERLNAKAYELQTDIIELEVLADHVHLLSQCGPQFWIHLVVKQLKGYTSHALRPEFPSLKRRLPSLWINSNFVATVGVVLVAVVQRYVEGQTET